MTTTVIAPRLLTNQRLPNTDDHPSSPQNARTAGDAPSSTSTCSQVAAGFSLSMT